MTIIPYFDPLLQKLRNSDVALISLASVTDPFVVNNLGVLSYASLNLVQFIHANGSSASIGYLTTTSLGVLSNASIHTGFFHGVNSSTISTNTLYSNSIYASQGSIGDLNLNNLQFNLTAGATVITEGLLNWDNTHGHLKYGLPGGNVDVALGMESMFPRRVRNSTGTNMPKGTVVYINGVSGNTPTIARAKADSDSTSAFTIGMTAEDINDGSTGWVTTYGVLSGINLSSYTAGDTLYLSGATAGLFTNTLQLAPLHYVRVGTVVKATSDGELVVNVLNGYETNEIHDIAILSLASGHVLQSDGSLWKNKSLSSVLAFLSLGSLAVQNTVNFYNLVSLPSLGSLSALNELSYASVVSKPSLGSLSALNSLALDDISDVTITSLASGNVIMYNGTNYINRSLATELINYPRFWGLLDEDPTTSISGYTDKNGDTYWNTLSESTQIYANRWRNVVPPDRLQRQNGGSLQQQNKAYLTKQG